MHDDDDVSDKQDSSGEPQDVDPTLTPSSTRTAEQEAEKIREKIAEIERKVADGN